jgi:ketosteroid isomerase-like protein
MSPNSQLRKALERFLATGESEVLDDEVEIYDHDLLDAEGYRGRDGFERWRERWASAWSRFRLDPKEYVEVGETVVVILDLTATGRGSAVTVHREDAMVCAVRDEKIVRIDYFNNRADALKALGREE